MTTTTPTPESLRPTPGAVRAAERQAQEYRLKWSCDFSDHYLHLALAKEKQIDQARAAIARCEGKGL